MLLGFGLRHISCIESIVICLIALQNLFFFKSLVLIIYFLLQTGLLTWTHALPLGSALLIPSLTQNAELNTLFFISIPYPLTMDSFGVDTYQEPLLVEFPMSFILDRAANITAAILGCFLATVLLIRLRRKGLFRRVSITHLSSFFFGLSGVGMC